MTRAYLTLTLALLSGCSTSGYHENPSSITAEGVLAFRDICLKTAPSFSGAENAAKAHGILKLTDAGFARMGLNKDDSLGVQVQAGKECAVTTPSQSDTTLTRQLLDVAGRFSSTPVAQNVPAKITVNQQSFILMHDRRGGEAYVLLKMP